VTGAGNYWGTATHFRIPAQAISEVNRLARQGSRIEAIKLIRTHARCGLAEAKAVVERIEGKEPNGPRLLPFMEIKSLVIDMGAGAVTVDLEGLQMTGLMQLERLGLDECRRILDLVALIEGWRDQGLASDQRARVGDYD
jgi:hypothetical protein